MHGLPTIGTIGLGWFEVSGRSLVPSPPAITTAFMPSPASSAFPRPRRRRATAAATAMPRPIQKSHSGQAVPGAVTSRKAMPA